jgi:hypothetical protein
MRAGKAIIIRNLQKTLQPWNRAVFVADYNLYGRQILLGLGTDHCILPAWQQRDRLRSPAPTILLATNPNYFRNLEGMWFPGTDREKEK